MRNPAQIKSRLRRNCDRSLKKSATKQEKATHKKDPSGPFDSFLNLNRPRKCVVHSAQCVAGHQAHITHNVSLMAAQDALLMRAFGEL